MPRRPAKPTSDEMTEIAPKPAAALSSRDAVLADYRVAWQSRHASLIGRREVLTGKAKFGIFGDGKELPQLAMARAFRPGDFRSGYYRDQTFMMAIGQLTLDQFFAQLYADADREREPASAGRQMNAHFASRLRAPTAPGSTSPPRRNPPPTCRRPPGRCRASSASAGRRGSTASCPSSPDSPSSRSNGDEIAFGTIGNASCAEGHFWEALDAIGVLRAPVLLSIWDDGYGISVPNELQHAKATCRSSSPASSASRASARGLDVYRVAAGTTRRWSRPTRMAADAVRREHVPAVLHVAELTQPQGHSTSGSHERYKSKERLAWEEEHDGLRKMRQWLLAA
jgi:TPP-dependent pyruvate/acetoin dehydrogenase alpha subunit